MNSLIMEGYKIIGGNGQTKSTLTLAELKTKLNEVSIKDRENPELLGDKFAQMRAL